METPLEARLGGGWMWLAGRIPGNQASAALCCPWGTAAQKQERARLRGFLTGLMPWGTWGQCCSLASNKKFHPTTRSQVSSGCFLRSRARVVSPVSATHRDHTSFQFLLAPFPSSNGHPQSQLALGSGVHGDTARVLSCVMSLFHLGLTHSPVFLPGDELVWDLLRPRSVPLSG